MSTIHVKGPGLNDWFADMSINDRGPEHALASTCGPAREAVERVIKARGIVVDEVKLAKIIEERRNV